MRIRSFWPGKAAVSRKKFYDSLAQPFFHKGNEIGCALLHGFTGTPANMRVVADALAQQDYTVYVPRLCGHASSLKEMDACSAEDWERDAFEAYDKLKQAGCERIFFMGLSMGALLTVFVASSRPCDGVVLMSMPLRMHNYLHRASKVSRVMPYVVAEERSPKYQNDSLLQGYNGAPLRRLRDLERMALSARGRLGYITCPVLILQPYNDHRVDLSSVEITRHGVNSKDVEVIYLENSPHACTVGPERMQIAAYCREFVRRIIR